MDEPGGGPTTLAKSQTTLEKRMRMGKLGQTVLTFVAEVQPNSIAGEKLRAVEANAQASRVVNPQRTGKPLSAASEQLNERLMELVPTLHFMSLTIFEDAHYDPLLVLEANFDGPPGPFWAQLEAAV